MILHSTITSDAPVYFPENNGERIYMLPFLQRDGLPPHLSRWQDTIDAMLSGIRANGPIYLMVDQGIVQSGQSHRRPGLHVEGNWRDGGHRGPRHNHDTYDPEMVILASDVAGSRAIVGDFTGRPGLEGQCDHIDVSNGREVLFLPRVAYRATVTTIHESLPLPFKTARTLVRLNLPNVSNS